MLDSKKPSNLIKRFQANDVELKVTFLDDKVQSFGVKVSFARRSDTVCVECAPCVSIYTLPFFGAELMDLISYSIRTTETMPGQGASAASARLSECQRTRILRH